MVEFLALKNKIRSVLASFYWDIGVDLGSSNIRIYLKDRGMVLEEPALLARKRRKRWTGLSAPKQKIVLPLAFGDKAKAIKSRESNGVEVVAPIERGVIADPEAAVSLLSYYLKMVYEIKSNYPKILKPRVVVGVPSNINSVQKRAFSSVFEAAGARKVHLVEQAVLVALGAGLPIARTASLMVVDVGGGKTEVSVVCLGRVVASRFLQLGGMDFDDQIVNFVKMKYGLLIGKNSAENLKIAWGNKDKEMLVRGRDLESHMPKTIKIGAWELSEALSLPLNRIVREVSVLLDEMGPDLVDDVLRRGIVLSGGGAKLAGLAGLIEKETKVNTRVADLPELMLIRGCGQVIESEDMNYQLKLVGGV